MGDVRVNEATSTSSATAQPKLAKVHTSQMSTTENSLLGWVSLKPNNAMNENVDNSIPTFSEYRQKTTKNTKKLNEIVKNITEKRSKAKIDNYGSSFQEEKNDIQVMGQVLNQCKKLQVKTDPNLPLIHQPSNNAFMNHISAKNQTPDGSGQFLEHIQVNNVQIPYLPNCERAAYAQACIQKEKIHASNAQNSFLCNKEDKELSIIQAQTKAFLKNTNEKGMLIVKKIATLQKKGFAQENERAMQAVEAPNGQHSAELSRQDTQLSNKAILLQQNESRHIPVQMLQREIYPPPPIGQGKNISSFENARQNRKLSPTRDFYARQPPAPLPPALAVNPQATEYYSGKNGQSGRVIAANRTQHTQLSPPHQPAHQPSEELLELRRRRTENTGRQLANACALCAQRAETALHNESVRAQMNCNMPMPTIANDYLSTRNILDENLYNREDRRKNPVENVPQAKISPIKKPKHSYKTQQKHKMSDNIGIEINSYYSNKSS